MQGNPQKIDRLNELLTLELTSINQYWLHARICENWGYERLWKKMREESLGEMKHADQLVARVLFLDGLPNLQRYAALQIGQTVPEIMAADLANELKAQALYNGSVELARSLGDNGSRELLEGILLDTEKHVDWLEAQHTLIEQMGLPNYLSQQMKKDSQPV